MKILFNKTNKKSFATVNFYENENEIKNNTDLQKFLNIKSEFKKEDEMNERNFIMVIRASIIKAKSEKIEKLAFDYIQIKKMLKEVLIKLESENNFLNNKSIQNQTLANDS
jgi:hypothetical protein